MTNRYHLHLASHGVWSLYDEARPSMQISSGRHERTVERQYGGNIHFRAADKKTAVAFVRAALAAITTSPTLEYALATAEDATGAKVRWERGSVQRNPRTGGPRLLPPTLTIS